MQRKPWNHMMSLDIATTTNSKIKTNKNYPLCRDGSDAGRSVLIQRTRDDISVNPKIDLDVTHLHNFFLPLLQHIARPI